MRVAVAMAVATILVVVAAACPVYMAVLSLSLPVIVPAARTMLVTVLSLRVRVAVLVLGLRHGLRTVSPCGADAKLARYKRHDDQGSTEFSRASQITGDRETNDLRFFSRP